jgi:hypothetical protein
MQFIRHRINTLEDLDNLHPADGAEIDVRYHLDQLVLHHDPFQLDAKGLLTLESFLSNWNCQGTLILNLKSEGIEDKCIELLQKHNVHNWFFLDMSMPFFVKYALQASNANNASISPANLCARFSDFEPLEYALSFSSMIEWIWVDTFKSFPLDLQAYQKIVSKNLKICLVSPELQGQPANHIKLIKAEIAEFNVHSVCTKYPELWR